ncbi:MAG: SusD/RagB family nutrient-binding outer membrane lipoprotein, partial [Bacteroidota bacterium]
AGFLAGGDPLFNGDAMKWRKLANALRLRYLLRISNQMGLEAAAQIQEIVANPADFPIMEGNADSGIYDFSGVRPDISDFSTQAITVVTGISMSEHLEENYTGLGDPRVDYFFLLPQNNAEYAQHEGVPNGLTREAAQSWNGNGDTNTSTLSERFISNPSSLDYTIMSFAEQQFILAEAAMNSWISAEDAATYYQAGIVANIEQWGLTASENYLNNPEVVWDGTMERLMEQKWWAFFWNNTIESWGEYKRTGLPNLEIGALANTVTNGQVPTRIFYPVLEQSINPNNYQEATNRLGGDLITIPHWYQN